MMKNPTLIWQIIVFILGLILILSIREYLLDRNEIEAEIGTKNCYLEHRKANLDSRYCEDIKDYKLKSRELFK